VLTLERIIAEMNYIVTDMDPFVRKILYFNLHDKIATLPEPSVDLSKRRAIFNRLLKPSHYKQVLRNRLATLPTPFDTKLSLLGDDLFQDLLSGCMNSIWAKNRVSPKGIRTRKTRSQINNGYIGQN